jgi:hypothetical protein
MPAPARSPVFGIALAAVLSLFEICNAQGSCNSNQVFQSPVSIGGFLNPRAVAVGDFNEDGIPDLVVTSPANFSHGGFGSRIGILIGNASGFQPNGTFQPEVTYAAGIEPYSAALGDFNGDGITDLAVTNWGGNNVSILFGNGSGGLGNGTFGPPHNVAAGSGPFFILAGDFNHDGITDLAVNNNGEPAVSILLGHGSAGIGNGTFGPRVVYPISQLSTGLASGDFNHDGITDLVATENYGSTVALLLGQGSGGFGDGTFAPATHVPAGIEPYWIEPNDFDGDGMLDLAVANTSSDGIKFLRGLGSGGIGNGTFGVPVTVAPGNVTGVVSGDFDFDGVIDLLISVSDPNVGPGNGVMRFLRGHHNGTFTASPVTYAVGRDPLVPVKGDFNGDGNLDVVFPNYYDSNISFLFGGCFDATAVQISFVDLHVDVDAVRLAWQLADGAGAMVDVERRAESAAWQELARTAADGTGRVEFEDRDIAPGGQYSYRLAVGAGEGRIVGGEIQATVPGLSLTLIGARPNPSFDGRVSIAFSLTGSEPAELRIIDAAGRLVASHAVGALGPGTHSIRALDEGSLKAGIYLVRLTQANRSVTGKVTVVR